MPNGNTITSAAQASIHLPTIPSNATLIHLFPGLQSHSLLSIGQLCDEGCEATFQQNDVKITYKKETLLEGARDPETGLWMIPVNVTRNIKGYANLVNAPTKVAELVAFMHASLFSPSITTLQKAIEKNFLHDFPGLTSKSIREFPPISIATIKGHLDQSRKNQRSTKQAPRPLQLLPMDDEDTVNEDFHPPQLAQGEITDHCFAATFEIDHTGQISTDQTGKFPIQARSGATQLMVLYDHDSNSIHAVTMQTKSAEDILKAYKTLHNTLKLAGRFPKLQRMDNECSTILREYITENKIKLQLVPPGIHRANPAERAIRTFKNHLIAGICSTDPNFPLNLWDQLIPQAVTTLNLLRASRINPMLSAHAQVFVQFAYNHTPLAPPGTHVLVHEKPHTRNTWAPHAVDAWYLGPSTDHHRCYRTWIWKTRSVRDTDTLTWLPKHVTLPELSPSEVILQCTAQIVDAIDNLMKNNPSEVLAPNEDAAKALTQFQDIFTRLHQTSELHETPQQTTPSIQRVVDTPTQGTGPPPEQRVVEHHRYATPPIPTDTPEPTEARRSQRGYKPSLRIRDRDGYSLSAVNVDTGKLTEYRQLTKTIQSNHACFYGSYDNYISS